jgi:predicted DNA binding CopG/RHH family protein
MVTNLDYDKMQIGLRLPKKDVALFRKHANRLGLNYMELIRSSLKKALNELESEYNENNK